MMYKQQIALPLNPFKEELKSLVRMLHVAGVVVNIKKALYQYDKDKVALFRDSR